MTDAVVPEIDYRLTGVGWSACTVRFGDAHCEVSASYLSDALGKLVLGAAAIVSGAHAVSVGFDEEPGEFRWAIVRESAQTVRVTVLSFPKLWANRPDAEGEAMLTFACDADDFGAAVWLAATRVRNAWPGEAYREQWLEHDFPTNALALLEIALGDAAPSAR